jgi:hypothetical protein
VEFNSITTLPYSKLYADGIGNNVLHYKECLV